VSRHVVCITDDRFGDDYAIERGVLAGIDVELRILSLDVATGPTPALEGASALLVNQFLVSASVIRSLPGLRVVSRYGVGYDNVDVEAATAARVRVAYVPDYASEDVSDHAVALLLACIRKIVYCDRRVRDGAWNVAKELTSFRTSGKTLGIIGYGRIGSVTHRKLNGFALARVLVHDPYLDPGLLRARGCVPADLRTLLRESDYVTIHAPLSTETRGMIGEAELALMKPQAILVNTARGPVVDEAALCRALRDRRIGYAGVDVFEREPPEPSSPLRGLDNVVLSGHIAWYTEESRVEMRTKAAANVRAVLDGRAPPYPLNDPGGSR
jgi:D-3-phosphoglycerate dehydrogenase / 2-oxoglutarate reductase